MRAGLALGLIAALPLLLGLAQPTRSPKVLEAERIVLQDANGKVWAEFGCQDGGPSLALFDEQGQCRARLAVESDGTSSLALYDREGHGRAVLHVRGEGEPVLNLDSKAIQALPKPARASDTAPAGTRLASTPPGPAKGPERTLTSRATEELYRRWCGSCHGSDGRGRRMRDSMPSLPDFTALPWQTSRTNVQLAAGILNGRGTDMPAFGDKLSAAQARQLVAFIRALGPRQVKPDDGGASDFDKRFEQLQRQWEELRKQAPTGPPSE
jgi:mono/diheme cytochrome c family protein